MSFNFWDKCLYMLTCELKLVELIHKSFQNIVLLKKHKRIIQFTKFENFHWLKIKYVQNLLLECTAIILFYQSIFSRESNEFQKI